ncbi:MAG: VWA domain-containing protein [Saprospiraceae bacterium]|nr:VWA domain-containing protein [Saprospiraceae bacterium]
MRKELQEKLEEEYERFIEFGALLNRQMRKYLVQYLENKLAPDKYVVPELNDQYFQYFKKALDQLFAVNHLIPTLRDNDHISYQLVLDTLYWLRKTYKKIRAKHPYTDEEDRLGGWSVTPIHIFVKRWYYLVDYLRKTYKKEEIDTSFYESQFKELIEQKAVEEIPAADRKKLDLVLTDLLAQWDALLYAKIFAYQLQKLEEEQEKYTQLLEAKVEEYQKLMQIITPVSDYLGWDMSRSLWQETSFDVVKEYDDLLEDEKSLKELADLLGSMREAEIEIEEEAFEKTIIRQEWVVDEHSKAEIVGVHESDDLNNLLSAEVGLLSDENTELLFLKRYADKNLLTFRYEDRKLVKSENVLTEVNQRVRLKEKGPFIICVDTSESMTGRPEQLAKVLCLGILKMAIKENRRAYLINFSQGIKTLDLYDVASSINEIAKFLRMSFYGGTDISLALYEAIRQLRSNDYQDADVLIISDFIMYKVNKDVLQDVKFFQQNKGTQFHSLTLSSEPNDQILNYFDTNWLYDPKKKGIIKEMTQGLKTIGS